MRITCQALKSGGYTFSLWIAADAAFVLAGPLINPQTHTESLSHTRSLCLTPCLYQALFSPPSSASRGSSVVCHSTAACHRSTPSSPPPPQPRPPPTRLLPLLMACLPRFCSPPTSSGAQTTGSSSASSFSAHQCTSFSQETPRNSATCNHPPSLPSASAIKPFPPLFLIS